MKHEMIFYSKIDCPLCDKAYKVIEELRNEIGESFSIRVIDIYKDEALIEKYGLMIPVVEINGVEVDYGIISKDTVKRALTLETQ